MSASPGWLARYQAWRRPAEVGFWVLVLGLQGGFNAVVSWLDRRHLGTPLPFWQPASWELSSVLALGLLVPAVIWMDRRFPLRWATLARNLPWHLAATVVFSVVHVGLMVALRQGAYALAGQQYKVGSWAAMLGYEYLKDVRTYAMVLLALWSYRLLLLRAQGEARVLDPPDPPVAAAGAPPSGSAAQAGAEVAAQPGAAPAPPPRPERFLVRKLRKEFLIAASDIDWLQAQANYVALRVQGHEYLLRSTLTEFLGQLDPARFVRVHRSYAVNLDRIAEIEPLESGDARLRMKDGGEVPCSRRYREVLSGR